MVIMAHWAILLGKIQTFWWLDGPGANIITEIATIIGIANWYLLN